MQLAFRITLKTMRKSNTDFMHHTNECFICKKDYDNILPVYIDRKAGFYGKLYTEREYCCNKCFNQYTSEKYK